jgi:hypothetical protein
MYLKQYLKKRLQKYSIVETRGRHNRNFFWIGGPAEKIGLDRIGGLSKKIGSDRWPSREFWIGSVALSEKLNRIDFSDPIQLCRPLVETPVGVYQQKTGLYMGTALSPIGLYVSIGAIAYVIKHFYTCP